MSASIKCIILNCDKCLFVRKNFYVKRIVVINLPEGCRKCIFRIKFLKASSFYSTASLMLLRAQVVLFTFKWLLLYRVPLCLMYCNSVLACPWIRGHKGFIGSKVVCFCHHIIENNDLIQCRLSLCQ